MDVASVVVGPVVESVVVRIKKHAGYIISSTKYVEDMRKEKQKLKDLYDGVEGHEKHNRIHHLVVPPEVTTWLEKAKDIIAQVDGRDIKAGSCFNFKNRRAVGSEACKMTIDIKRLIDEGKTLTWFDDPIPLGIIDSTVASTSAPVPSSDHYEYLSRMVTFTSALEALGPDHDSSMVALWGMGGVGKSTMVKKLKEAVEKRGWFQLIVDVAAGEDMNIITLQGRVADYVCEPLKQEGENARADTLHRSFEVYSKDGKIKNILVILDNVWEPFDLKDIGLDPLPKEGAGFKFLLTSRDNKVCRMMGVEKKITIFKLKCLENSESQRLFRQIVRDPDDADLDSEFQAIGDAIANGCQGLPIAINTIARFLKGQTKDVWEDSLTRLKNHDPYVVANNVFKLSYEKLKDREAEAILLLCGVFPKNADIPIKDLVKYGWGLNLFKKVNTIKEARQRLSTCLKKLEETNFLSESHHPAFYTMHDLVRAFVLDMLSKDEHASIVNHGTKSEWPSDDTGDLCTSISVTSTNGYEFPSGLMFPKLSFLKLTQGDGSFKFPQDFYGGMEKLKVIGFERMVNPLLPTSFPYSSNIRVLCLHQCSLMFDYSSIGNLKNLEVLSFANSCIEKLPSTIGNLTRLKVLDLTGCLDILIDDNILRKLVNLEELYMIPSYGEIISFTDESCNGLANISKNLTTLEIRFCGRNTRPKKLSLEKLERFTIYMGHDEKIPPYGNTLKLVTCTDDLLESSINELFGKTEMLYLQVNDMHSLEDVMVKSPHITNYNSHFSCLKVLKVSNCSELGYLFTFNVAATLSNIEHLEISSCNKMETLIHIGKEQTIRFPKLKVLSLNRLPELSGYLFNEQVVIPMLEELHIKNMENLKEIWLCRSGAEEIDVSMLRKIQVHNCDNLVNLFPKNPMILLHRLEEVAVRHCGSVQVLFNMEVVMVPNLEVLHVRGMENLKAIWPCQHVANEEANVSLLREIKVEWCRSLVNLFPENPMTLLHHLEKVEINSCNSLPVLFNINLDRLRKTEQLCSSLRRIVVDSSKNLREIWSINGENDVSFIIGGVEVVKIFINCCQNFKINAFTTTFFYFKPLMDLDVRMSARRKRNQEEEEINVGVMFPTYFTQISHHLVNIYLTNFQEVDVVFEVKSPSNQKSVKAQNTQQPLLPLPSYLKRMELRGMKRMSHVWKCNWTEFLNLRKQPNECSFLNLTTIALRLCNNLKYLFSPLMVELLPNLSEVDIKHCKGMEEVVSSRDDGEMTSMHARMPLFPRLNLLNLYDAPSLERIGGGATRGASNEISDKYSQVGAVSWSLCQYSRQICIRECDALPCVVPFYAFTKMHQLQVLQIYSCKSMMEVFESQGINNSGDSSTTYADESRDGGTSVVLATPRVKDFEVPQLSNQLKEVDIYRCDSLLHVSTFSTLEGLSQLVALNIGECEAMKVIVKDEDGHRTAASKAVCFPHLESIKLYSLPSLEGFFLGKNEIQWPMLEIVTITNCPKMTIFPFGQSTPKLQLLQIHCCKSMMEVFESQGINNSGDRSTTYADERRGTSVVLATPRVKEIEVPLLSNLTEVDIYGCDALPHVFTFSTLESLLQVRVLKISQCEAMKVIVKDEDGHRTAASKAVCFPHLESIELYSLPSLEGFFLGKNEFQWPMLENVTIMNCPKMTIFPFGQSTPKLQVLKIHCCKSMTEVFESQGINNSGDGSTTYADERRDCGTSVVLATPRVKDIEAPRLSNLKEVNISNCDILQYVFTFSTLESLSQLVALTIRNCEAMKVIVKDEDGPRTAASKAVFFHHLKSMELHNLTSLEGFFLGKNEFLWPVLDNVTIANCPKMTIFTFGQSTAKKLKFIRTSLGIHTLEFDLKAQTKFPDTESTRSHPTTLEQSAWSFHNLSEMIVKNDHSIERIVPSIELLQLQKLVKILVRRCNQLEEVFEVVALEEINDRIGFSEAQKAVVELPNLTEMDLEHLPRLKYICKSNQWTVVKFPYLTRLSVVGCGELEYVFTSSMVGSLPQLQELRVSRAATKVIVKEEEEFEGKVNEHELRNLKSLELESLPYLKGFCLGNDAFSWPSLFSLRIFNCPEIDVFTNGHSDTPELKVIKTSFGECNVGNDLNSFIKTNQQSFQNSFNEERKWVSEIDPEWEIHDIELTM